VAYSHVSVLVKNPNIKPADIEKTRQTISQDIETFEGLLSTNQTQNIKGGELQCVLSNCG
jgi:hypothetical protein